MIHFESGPKIRLLIEFEGFQLKKSTLELAAQFECQLLGEPSEQLKTDLLAFLDSYRKHQNLALLNPLLSSNIPLSPFRRKVLATLEKVPSGCVVSYGQLAELSGHPKAARAVGSVCHYNPFPLFIPCHRVISGDGTIGGFAFNKEIKKRLLDFELGLCHAYVTP